MSSESTDQSRARAPHLGPRRRRPQILDAALEIAVGEGLTALTMASVADRLRVTRPVVYSCFDDRAELVEALCRREDQYFVGELLCALPYGGLGEDDTALAGSLHTLLRLSAARPLSWQFLTGTGARVLSDRQDGGGPLIRHRCTALLEASLEDWGVPSATRKAPVLAEQWLAAGQGAVATLLRDPGAWTAEELGGYVGASVYRMIREA